MVKKGEEPCLQIKLDLRCLFCKYVLHEMKLLINKCERSKGQ